VLSALPHVLVDILVTQSTACSFLTTLCAHFLIFIEIQQAGNLVLVFLNIVVTLSFSTVPYVDWAAHTGGLLGGMLLSAVIFSEYIKTPTTRLGVRVVASAALVAYLVISFVVVATILEPDEDLLHVCKHFRNALNDQAIPC